ncbi:MAG: tRNA modification GTPase [Planctomycetota bacterium]|nr:MAG: tRNA modification GTPase [Planctomycetota bacterium]
MAIQINMRRKNHPAETDTIVAVSTPRGAAPVAIIRLSGPQAIRMAGAAFPAVVRTAGRYTAIPGTLKLAGGLRLPVVAYVMRAPASYTREDVVELHAAGAPVILKLILQTLYGAGARPAGPGEFTRRAFQNGRIDLAQAEAVMAVINASDTAALRAAQFALRGERSRVLTSLRDRTLELLARVEVDLDFDEDEAGELDPGELQSELEAIVSALEEAGSAPGRPADESVIRVAFFGLPNAGKSSLLNMLAGSDHAVVRPEPGTTRDPVTAELVHDGISLKLIDPAGVGKTAETGYIAGQARKAALRTHEEADIIIFVHDINLDVSDDEHGLFESVDKPAVLALNKIDLPGRGRMPDSWQTALRVETSCIRGEGRERLLDAVTLLVREGKVDLSADYGSISARHARHIDGAKEAINRIRGGLHQAGADERLAFELRECLHEIGCIIGESTTDDLLDVIFSSFCIGK